MSIVIYNEKIAPQKADRNKQIADRRILCQYLLHSGHMEDVGIGSLDLSTRTYNALIRSDRRTISDLLSTTPSELHQIKNLGENSVQEVETLMTDLGLHLKTE